MELSCAMKEGEINLSYKTAKIGGVEFRFYSPKKIMPHKATFKDMLCAAGKVMSAEILERIYDYSSISIPLDSAYRRMKRISLFNFLRSSRSISSSFASGSSYFIESLISDIVKYD